MHEWTNEPMPSTSPCLNAALHELTDVTFFTHTVHAPRPRLFTEQILPFIYASSNSISSETVVFGADMCHPLFWTLHHSSILPAYMLLCTQLFFFLDLCPLLVGTCWTDNINQIPRLKGDGAVIPGTVNNVRKALTTSRGKQKTQADDQALSPSRLLFKLAERPNHLFEYLALREHLENVCWNCVFTNLPLEL